MPLPKNMFSQFAAQLSGNAPAPSEGTSSESAAQAPAPAPVPNPAPANIVTDASAAQALNGAYDEGFKAATSRFSAVMATPEAQANVDLALDFLADEDMAGLSAEKLTAKLGKVKAPVAPAPTPAPTPERTGADTDAAKAIEASTPKVKLGQAPGQARGSEEKGEKEVTRSVQDEVLAGFNAAHEPMYGALPNSGVRPTA